MEKKSKVLAWIGGVAGLLAGIFVLWMTAFTPSAFAGESSYGMPAKVDPSASYLIFLHNYYVEKNGPDGDCKYYDILKTFADNGFIVVSETRTGKIVPCTYAAKVVKQVNALLDAGVPPQHITVAGHSKGGVIALCAASELKNPNLNFETMAGCEIAGVKRYNMYPDFRLLQGRMLSIFATSDTVAQSCRTAFAKAPDGLTDTEIELENSKGHRLFFAPDDVWVLPTIDWINQSRN